MTFAFPGSYQVGAWLLSAIGIYRMARSRISRNDFVEFFKHIPLLPAYFIFATVCFIIFTIHDEPASSYGLSLQFLVFPMMLVALAGQKLDSRYFFVGAAVGGVVALGIAAFQVYYLDMYRAAGLNGPIRLGNTSVVLGAAALIGFAYLRHTINSRPIRWLLLAGGMAGFTASLLSGSKGGWLSLIMVAIIFIGIVTRGANRSKRLLYFFSALIMMVCVSAFLPKSAVWDRISSAYRGTVVWINTGKVTEDSASIRLETNKMAWFIAMKSPWIGIPVREKFERMEEIVNEGLVDDVVLQYKAIDNDILETLVSKGVLGLVTTFFVHVCTFIVFFRFRRDSVVAVRALAALGMMLPILYCEFGLASAIFSTTIFRTIYISWSMVLLGMIFAERRHFHPE